MSLDLAVSAAKCSVKTEAVRIQELSLGSSADNERQRQRERSPKRKQRPPSGTLPTDLTSLSAELPNDKKRGNKRALLTTVPGDRRRNGEVVEVEGMLVVAEQVGKGETPDFRTLGSIYCVLVRKSGGLFLETVSKDSHHSIVLDVDAMDLTHEPFKRDRKFYLNCRLSGSGNGRAPSYAFTASTKEEYVEWLNGVLRCQAAGERDREFSAVKASKGVESVALDSVRGETRMSGQSNGQLQTLHEEACQEQAQPSIGDFVYATPPRTKHILLIRHGHYINAHAPQAPDSQQVLSQMGRQQAEFTGKYLGTAHNRIPTRNDVAIFHSDMTRAVETADIIGNNYGEVSLNPTPLLREGWPGAPYSIVGGARNNSALASMHERSRGDVERMEKAFHRFFLTSNEAQEGSDEESYCVLVCHANLIRFFLCRALGIDPANTWGHFEINHCGVTRIDVCANRPIKVIAVNETGHLPQSLITSSEDHL